MWNLWKRPMPLKKGGNYKEDLIEEITQLAEEHLNFSHQSRLGGYHVVAGSGWTPEESLLLQAVFR